MLTNDHWDQLKLDFKKELEMLFKIDLRKFLYDYCKFHKWVDTSRYRFRCLFCVQSDFAHWPLKTWTARPITMAVCVCVARNNPIRFRSFTLRYIYRIAYGSEHSNRSTFLVKPASYTKSIYWTQNYRRLRLTTHSISCWLNTTGITRDQSTSVWCRNLHSTLLPNQMINNKTVIYGVPCGSLSFSQPILKRILPSKCGITWKLQSNFLMQNANHIDDAYALSHGISRLLITSYMQCAEIQTLAFALSCQLKLHATSSNNLGKSGNHQSTRRHCWAEIGKHPHQTELPHFNTIWRNKSSARTYVYFPILWLYLVNVASRVVMWRRKRAQLACWMINE